MNQEKNKNIPLIVLILMIVLIIVFLVFYFYHKESTGKHLSENDSISNQQKAIDIQNYVSLTKADSDKDTYVIDLFSATKNANINDKLTFKLGDDYNIQLLLTDSPYDFVICFEMYVNGVNMGKHGVRIYEEKANFSINMLGKYLVYITPFATDIRSQSVFVIEGTQQTEIYELETEKGMKPSKINLTSNEIIIEGTRIDHGPAIEYGGKTYDVYTNEGCQNTLNSLSNELIVKATYTYRYENGILNLLPIITDRLTLEEYLTQNSLCMY